MTTTRRHRSNRVTAGLALALVLAGTAGCGDDSGEEDAAALAESSPTADNPALAAIEITAVDYRFAISPPRWRRAPRWPCETSRPVRCTSSSRCDWLMTKTAPLASSLRCLSEIGARCSPDHQRSYSWRLRATKASPPSVTAPSTSRAGTCSCASSRSAAILTPTSTRSKQTPGSHRRCPAARRTSPQACTARSPSDDPSRRGQGTALTAVADQGGTRRTRNPAGRGGSSPRTRRSSDL